MTKKLFALITTLSIFALQVAPTWAQETTKLPAEITNMRSEGFTINAAEPNGINPRKFIFELKPGGQTREKVVIKNLSNQKSTFFLYGADATFSTQGTPAYKTREAGGDGEGKWITFDEPEIVLGGNEEKTVSFTLAIPPKTELGEYRVGISMEKTKKDARNANVTIATRLILHSSIKVTDNPQVISKLNGENSRAEPEPEPEEKKLHVYYFWVSLVLFIISLITLIWVTFQEKKHPLETVSTKAVEDEAAKRARKQKAARKRKTSAKKKK